MATLYSRHFATAAAPGTLDNQLRASAGIAWARSRKKYIAFDAIAVTAASDLIICGQFKSGDRIETITLSHEDYGTTGTIDLGLYKSGTAHDGSVIVGDMYCDGLDVAGGVVNDVEAFSNGDLTGLDRGLTLWEQAENDGWTNTSPKGAGNNPGEDWDLVMKIATSGTPAATWQFNMIVTCGGND